MRRRVLDDDDAAGEFDDSDDGSIPCPYCGRAILEDSPRCPHCENYLSQEDVPADRKPWWIVLGAIVCLYLVYRWTVG